MKKTKTTSASKIVFDRFYKSKPDRIESLRQTGNEMDLADKIRRLREEAGLTQAQLAAKIGTSGSGISRIEDADYDGHSTNLLKRLAEALDMRLVIDFEPKYPKKPHANQM